ncbi:MAG: hypothetical protein OXC72_03685 [Roseovarius sp.]|nr:hypothetical protein [Roseovarius sp.]
MQNLLAETLEQMKKDGLIGPRQEPVPLQTEDVYVRAHTRKKPTRSGEPDKCN